MWYHRTVRPDNEALKEKHRLHALGLRRCFSCTQTLPVDQFGAYKGGFAGLQPSCRPCTNARNRTYAVSPEALARKLENQRLRREANPLTPAEHRRNNLRKLYKMTPEDYDRLLARQGGACAICGGTSPGGRRGVETFNVDHCHKTGRVRGLLCTPCNRGIGLLGDASDLLRAAAAYLSRFEETAA